MDRMTAFILAALVAASTLPMAAHDQLRIVGVVTKREPKSILVKPKGPVPSTIYLDEHTVVVRDDKQVTLSDLKVGVTVVVDALGDTEDDMTAVFIRIVPPVKDGK